MKLTEGHDGTIVHGISRIGFMAGGKAARWVDEDIADTLTRKAVSFIERSKDKPFFLYFATHDVHVPRAPHKRFVGTSGCGTRGDVIQQMDWSVGEVLDTLERAEARLQASTATVSGRVRVAVFQSAACVKNGA